MPPICFGCEIGDASSSLTTIIAIIGAATGLVGTVVGVLGFLKSDETAQQALFREEFERHRVPLESAIQQMKRLAGVLRPSAHRVMPITSLVANFQNEKVEVNQAVETLLTEADEIDLRKLTSGSWVMKFRPSQNAIDDAWELLEDPEQTEPALRSSAMVIVANLERLVADTRNEISQCVRRPPRWGKSKKR